MGQIIRHGYSQYARRGSTRAYRRAREQVLAAARLHGTPCFFCHQPERTDDPFECHHVTRMRDGGYDDVSNLRAAHRSCNRRGGPPQR
jgi:HNH endonuclease